MKRMLVVSMLMAATALAVAAGPALAAGDFELRVGERLTGGVSVSGATVTVPAQSRATSQSSFRDPTLFDQNGVFQGARVR